MPHSLSSDRRTAVDEIFDHLRAEIDALRLRPGDRISEAEIAARFGVSRQPVRDAARGAAPVRPRPAAAPVRSTSAPSTARPVAAAIADGGDGTRFQRCRAS